MRVRVLATLRIVTGIGDPLPGENVGVPVGGGVPTPPSSEKKSALPVDELLVAGGAC